jgi:hypothetical protein
MALTHFRIIYPLTVNPMTNIKFGYEDGRAIASVLFKNIWWQEIGKPAFMDGMDVHIGQAQPDDVDLFGKTVRQPAIGILRGEYIRFEESHEMHPAIWLVFALRYDMAEGPEEWQSDRHLVMGEGDGAPRLRLKFTEL